MKEKESENQSDRENDQIERKIKREWESEYVFSQEKFISETRGISYFLSLSIFVCILLHAHICICDFDSYLTHRIIDSFPRILKLNKYKIKTSIGRPDAHKTGINFMIFISIFYTLHAFSVLLITGSNKRKMIGLEVILEIITFLGW